MISIETICIEVPTLTQQNVLVTICPDDKDRYRFGFNGQEKVNEWSGVGNFMSYEARGLDTRTGRWLAIDPDMRRYPSTSPYSAMDNSPISLIDPTGKGAIAYRLGNSTLVTATIYVYSHDASIDMKKYRAKIESDINYQLNHPVVFDEKGNMLQSVDALDQDGRPLKFYITVKVLTYEGAQREAAKNKASMDYSVNFMELTQSTSAASEVPGVGNSGTYNIHDLDNRGSSTSAHEFGHLLAYFSGAIFSGRNSLEENHAFDYEINNLMWQGIVSGVESEVPMDKRLEKRRATPSFYMRINNGKGLSTGWNGNQLNIGNKPDNVINPPNSSSDKRSDELERGNLHPENR